jgi:AcrR family transcriptional regulator
VPALTRQRIIDTAIALADRDGFEAVTLRRIAAELGVHVTSLYNHVATREAVTDGIVETLIDHAGLPLSPVGWEEWVRRFFAALGTVAEAHPGAFTALQRRPVQGPYAAASFEVALAAFSKAGFSPADAYSAVKATSLTALAVGLERSMSSQGQLVETAIDELPEAEFPHVRAARQVHDPEVAWSFSLEALVAGLRSQLRRRRVPAGR